MSISQVQSTSAASATSASETSLEKQLQTLQKQLTTEGQSQDNATVKQQKEAQIQQEIVLVESQIQQQQSRGSTGSPSAIDVQA